MDRLTAEEVARARELLASALPSTPTAESEPVEPEPEPIDPRRAKEKALTAAWVERQVAKAPPLTQEQLDKLTAILRPTLSRRVS